MMIITKGCGQGRIGGVTTEVREGQAIYIGPGVSHEFWNDGRKPCEGIIVMFGDGA